MNRIAQGLEQISKDLLELKSDFALVGGLALGIRSIPRQTIDIDLAVVVNSESQLNSLVDTLVLKGYGISNLYKNEQTGKIFLAKLFLPNNDESYLIEVDILLDLCGIEKEVVQEAEYLQLWQGFGIKVASLPALIAMKARIQQLEDREQDKVDLKKYLLPIASLEDIEKAKELISLIVERGFNDGRDILSAFNDLVSITRKRLE